MSWKAAARDFLAVGYLGREGTLMRRNSDVLWCLFSHRCRQNDSRKSFTNQFPKQTLQGRFRMQWPSYRWLTRQEDIDPATEIPENWGNSMLHPEPLNMWLCTTAWDDKQLFRGLTREGLGLKGLALTEFRAHGRLASLNLKPLTQNPKLYTQNPDV